MTRSRGSVTLASLVVAVGLVACTTERARPAPPTIEVAGLIETVEIHAESVRYRLADGRTWEAPNGVYRTVRPGSTGGGLLVAGTDAAGRFVATFSTQDGLPKDCYVENATGIDWRDGIELRGIYWVKDAGFTSDVSVPEAGAAYPSGTRFCLDGGGRITSAIGP